MSLDSDVVLIGTGVAPLVTANELLAQGRSVLLLNPARDFFLEDSELPLDPLWPGNTTEWTTERLAASNAEIALAELGPTFPGAVETWAEGRDATGFHDRNAPHIRQRSRLWVSSPGGDELAWDSLEGLYVVAEDAGLNPQVLEGYQTTMRFPGYAGPARDCRGLLIPKFCDVDVNRYRVGLLEFIRERLESDRLLCGANPIELIPGGVCFNSGGVTRTVRAREKVIVFWTPSLTRWVLKEARKREVAPVSPTGVRIWEEWSLVSREALDPGTIGMFEDMAVWADVEGAPTAGGPSAAPGGNRLAVLHAGPLLGLDATISLDVSSIWASSESFGALGRLCGSFLGWNGYSVRSLRPRALFEWKAEAEAWRLSSSGVPVEVTPRCDGPLIEVVRAARQVSQQIERGTR